MSADEIYDTEMRRFVKLVNAIIPILKEYGYKFHGWTTQFHDRDMIFRGEIQFQRDCKEERRNE